jgi:PHD/YefM family antitoxin component YafN of YafNO toxin-antitoxin module
VTFPSSDLSRNPAKVFGAAEESPVRLTRRDGQNLVLMAEQDYNAREDLLRLAAEFIALALEGEGNLVERMAHRFSWMLALNEKDQAACTADLIRAARASFSTGARPLLLSTLDSWRGTAEAIALGLDKVPTDWLDKPERVERPK